ncbi:MAG: S1 RNA-binding domain-containing protein [Anaerolineales bacterium]|nr:S1 RNA-binding domain-containing protein [Anaerolineales bacterium]
MSDNNKDAKIKLSDLKPNTPLNGTVTKIELFGAFVDVGAETPGLIHISKVKLGHVNRIDDVLQEGQDVEVWVEKVDANSGRLELTMIRPIELKWKDIKLGLKIKGKVVKLESFGAFVDIGAERHGLVHVSEMSSDYISDPSEIVKLGDKIDVVILGIDRKKRQIKLSMKAVEEEEAMKEAELEEEEVPTAMEVALRRAIEENEQDAPQPEIEKSAPQKEKGQKELDDILSRTLEQRMKSSTDT